MNQTSSNSAADRHQNTPTVSEVAPPFNARTHRIRHLKSSTLKSTQLRRNAYAFRGYSGGLCMCVCGINTHTPAQVDLQASRSCWNCSQSGVKSSVSTARAPGVGLGLGTRLGGQFLFTKGAFSDPQTSTKMTQFSVETTFCSRARESVLNTNIWACS